MVHIFPLGFVGEIPFIRFFYFPSFFRLGKPEIKKRNFWEVQVLNNYYLTPIQLPNKTWPAREGFFE